MTGLVLRPLAQTDEVAARAAHEELLADGFLFLLDYDPGMPWPEYLAILGRQSRGEDLPADRVPADLLAAVVDGELVGRSSIRHELNDWLFQYGGHIGYGVRPAYRRRGYATAILQRSLARLAELGVDRALVTCDDGNVASATVIERCGGVLENVVPGPEDEDPKRRYWVDARPYREAQS